MATFKRILNDAQREAMIRRKRAAVKAVMRLPRVETYFVAGGNRTDVENITIARTHAKGGTVQRKAHTRRGKHVRAHPATYDRQRVFRMTAGEARRIHRDPIVRSMLDEVRNGDVSKLAKALDLIGSMIRLVYDRHPGMVHTRTLKRSVRWRVVL